jgi:hypothetical protein
MKLLTVIAIALLVIFVVDVHSESAVSIEFFFRNPTSLPGYCPTCPGWGDALRQYIAASNAINAIQIEYGDQVEIERVDRMTTEGDERCEQYNCTTPQTVIINHTIKLEAEQITTENLKQIIDEYLAGEEPDGNPFDSQPFTLIGAFSLGFCLSYSAIRLEKQPVLERALCVS